MCFVCDHRSNERKKIKLCFLCEEKCSSQLYLFSSHLFLFVTQQLVNYQDLYWNQIFPPTSDSGWVHVVSLFVDILQEQVTLFRSPGIPGTPGLKQHMYKEPTSSNWAITPQALEPWAWLLEVRTPLEVEGGTEAAEGAGGPEAAQVVDVQDVATLEEDPWLEVEVHPW